MLKNIRAGFWWFHAEDSDDADTVGLDTNFEEFTDVMSVNTHIEADRLIFGGTLWGPGSGRVRASSARGLDLAPFVDKTECNSFVT